jgi:exopolysaccharide production protein ExoQ
MLIHSPAGIGKKKHAVARGLAGQQQRVSSAPRSVTFPGRSLLAFVPVVVFFYVLVVLPFMGGEGKTRIENVLFWPALAGIVLALAAYNYSLLDKGFIFSLVVTSLVAYMAFSAASITWAYNSDIAFTRYAGQLLIVIIVLVPYALPIDTSRTMQRLHVCALIAVAINAVYVLTTPPTSVGHTGYFIHKQELGMLCGATIILSTHELLFRGWRRWLAVISFCLTFWVIFESQSKGSIAFFLVASSFSIGALFASKLLRTSPAFIVGACVLAFGALSYVWSDPVGRISWKLYGDSTLTGRTVIWDFINYQVSHNSWFGWGFQSYWGVPNSPHDLAPGFVKDMVSSHSGYLELKLDTGHIGYWIFLVFVYASLHNLETVRRKDPIRAWVLLALSMYIILLNLIESVWIHTIPLWILYLIVVGAALRFSRSENGAVALSRRPVQAKRHTGLLPRRTTQV